ncbi:MAG: hypothetical protein GX112_13880 [Clostridiaceae bacterium]|jgi:hypothetical protein|nr:hypothetical protein [Clostridiaceae bacterium]
MFGYVCPYKPELLIREYARYRAVYCGLCRQIRLDYGQLPRLAVSYDLTFLALFLLALTDSQPSEQMAGCVLDPLRKKPMLAGGPVLEACAALAVQLAWHKAGDQIRDGHPLGGRLARLAFWRAWRRASRRWPDVETIIRERLAELHQLENGPPDLAAADIFGRMLEALARQAAKPLALPAAIHAAVGCLARDLGRWVYLIDAIDDWQDDCNNKTWNPFGRTDLAAARLRAEPALTGLEESMDRTAALMPYVRDSGLLANLFTLGLPEIRRQVLAGQHPGRRHKSPKGIEHGKITL